MRRLDFFAALFIALIVASIGSPAPSFADDGGEVLANESLEAAPTADASLPQSACAAPTMSVDRPTATVAAAGKRPAPRSWSHGLGQEGDGLAAESCSCSGTCSFFFECECTSCSLNCDLWGCYSCCQDGCREHCSPF